MSQAYYMKEWDVAQENLKFVINTVERPPKPEPLPKTLKEAFARVCYRYIQYISIYKKLSSCYDHMVHPQKRNLIARCIEGVIGRILELRHELLRIEMNEYAPFGPFCAAHHLLPSDLEFGLTRTFAYEKVQRLQQRADLLDYLLLSMGKTDDFDALSVSSQATSSGDKKKRLTSSNIDLQIGTRSQSYNDMMQEKRKTVNWKKVQSRFKIFQQRILLAKLRSNTDKYLNMEYRGATPDELEEAEKQIFVNSIQTAQHHEDEYIQRLIVEADSLKDTAAARNFQEDMKQNIRQWMLECRAATGNFPEYPSQEIGGSEAIFALKSVEEVADELDFGQDEKMKLKSKDKAKDKKPSKRPEPPEGFILRASNFVDEVLAKVDNEYDIYWRGRDEEDNFKQQFCPNLLQERVNEELEDLLRQQIDEQMRQELELLTIAVEKTQMAKGKPKKAKPDKKKKKDKRKRLKDLTPNADLEDLYTELVRNDIIRRVHPVSLKDYLGEVNLIADGDSERLECRPDLGDIRRMMFDFVVLPMSNKNVREYAPCCKSLLIVGPRGSGKRMLVHAVCNDLGANFFDLSPANIHDKYTEYDGTQMLMHLVMKVGKILEPSIIYIDNCEQMFTKKLPPEVKTNPARIKTSLIKAMKTVGFDDRIMLIGSTSRPYNANRSALLKMYERIIFIYPPTYASRYTIWDKAIRMYEGNITRSLTISTLAQISSSFTASDIFNTVRDVLNKQRIQRQLTKTLHTSEFGNALSEFTPLYTEEVDALVTWLKETPLYKKRKEVRALEEAGVNIFDLI